jgi:hypothetical protein
MRSSPLKETGVARSRGVRYAIHTLLAGLLAPYLVTIVLGLLGPPWGTEIRLKQVFLDFPAQVFTFGAPILLLFIVLSFFPLQAVLQISDVETLRRAFLLTGFLLGLLAGLLLGRSVPGTDLILPVIGTCVVGVFCGYLDWIVWRPRSAPPM